MTCECALELVMRFGAVLWSGALELVLVLCESYVLMLMWALFVCVCVIVGMLIR